MNRDARIGVAMILAAMVIASGLGVYFGLLIAPKSTQVKPAGPFQLSLIEPMNTAWNSTMAQPKYYVVGAGGLGSSANIALPAKTLIELTIVSYDSPTANSTDAQGLVNGTVGGNVYLINGTQASMSNSPMPFGQNVTSVPGAILAHTFTIQQLGINIPVVGGDTVVAYLYFSGPGTYTWICLTPCGFGPKGDQGAMNTAGWMTGTITVS